MSAGDFDPKRQPPEIGRPWTSLTGPTEEEREMERLRALAKNLRAEAEAYLAELEASRAENTDLRRRLAGGDGRRWTVKEIERLKAEAAELRTALEALKTCGMDCGECVACLRFERDALKARAEKAEAERDARFTREQVVEEGDEMVAQERKRCEVVAIEAVVHLILENKNVHPIDMAAAFRLYRARSKPEGA